MSAGGFAMRAIGREMARRRAATWGVYGARRMFATEAAAAAGDKMVLNFVVPDKAIVSKSRVEMVVLPATRGEMGVLPNHVATMAQLKPGVVAVHNGGSVEKYFISTGFAFISPEVTDVVVGEAVAVEDIDADAVAKGLDQAESAYSAATTDLEKAEAQIGVDVFAAMKEALGGK